MESFEIRRINGLDGLQRQVIKTDRARILLVLSVLMPRFQSTASIRKRFQSCICLFLFYLPIIALQNIESFI